MEMAKSARLAMALRAEHAVGEFDGPSELADVLGAKYKWARGAGLL